MEVIWKNENLTLILSCDLIIALGVRQEPSRGATRQAAELTQVELARRMGVTQAAISRMEQPHDLLLSTLNSYLQAIGGTARMVVSFADGHETTLDLSQLA